MSLQVFFDNAIQELSRQKSASLGDRATYIGASDIGGCPRKVVFSKLYPVAHTTKTLMRFSRGHLAEEMLDKIFTAGGATYERQVEVSHHAEPFRAHLDFLFFGGTETSPLHVLEVKSVASFPDEPYPSWLDQLFFQMGLLREQYPQARITGSILAVDVNAGEYQEYAGFAPNDDVFQYLVSRGLYLLACLGDQEDPRPETGLLCGFCDYRDDCPAFACEQVSIPGDVEVLAQRYSELNEVKGTAEKELKTIKGEIVNFTGERFRGGTERLEIIVSSVGPSETVDGKLLQAQFPEVYRQVLKPKAGFTKLEVRQARTAKLRAAA